MNARSAAERLAQAEQCVSDGAKVGVITDLDRGTSIAIQKRSAAVGGKTIDYDRQIVSRTGSVYVSFNGNLVDRPQALGVLGGMKAKGTYGPNGVVSTLERPDERERVRSRAATTTS